VKGFRGVGCTLDASGTDTEGVPVSVTVGAGPSCPARALTRMTKAMISAPTITTTAMKAMMTAPVIPIANAPAVLAVLFADGGVRGANGAAGVLHMRPSH
jgi:hypothetical protein